MYRPNFVYMDVCLGGEGDEKDIEKLVDIIYEKMKGFKNLMQFEAFLLNVANFIQKNFENKDFYGKNFRGNLMFLPYVSPFIHGSFAELGERPSYGIMSAYWYWCWGMLGGCLEMNPDYEPSSSGPTDLPPATPSRQADATKTVAAPASIGQPTATVQVVSTDSALVAPSGTTKVDLANAVAPLVAAGSDSTDTATAYGCNPALAESSETANVDSTDHCGPDPK
ncbi:hypothetical protein AGMMS49949_00190 [Alphaproteobacteria bacterium]|nr:hypothetical protein AGMMS49949_00190 [Alphaproteobacteria bacterium]GHS97853.1 hypothetical protein AGMMS50296_5120 [Alphaproteobacteria bacterium]